MWGYSAGTLERRKRAGIRSFTALTPSVKGKTIVSLICILRPPSIPSFSASPSTQVPNIRSKMIQVAP